MNPNLIFPPMGVMALLTFTVLGLVPLQRFRAGARGEVTTDDFKLGESSRVPERTALPNRNYMNLLELPTLFYPVCLMFHVANRVDGVVLATAWAFVATRCLHSLIHLTTNTVRWRMMAFAAGNFVLGALWLEFFLRA